MSRHCGGAIPPLRTRARRSWSSAGRWCTLVPVLLSLLLVQSLIGLILLLNDFGLDRDCTKSIYLPSLSEDVVESKECKHSMFWIILIISCFRYKHGIIRHRNWSKFKTISDFPVKCESIRRVLWRFTTIKRRKTIDNQKSYEGLLSVKCT